MLTQISTVCGVWTRYSREEFFLAPLFFPVDHSPFGYSRTLPYDLLKTVGLKFARFYVELLLPLITISQSRPIPRQLIAPSVIDVALS